MNHKVISDITKEIISVTNLNVFDSYGFQPHYDITVRIGIIHLPSGIPKIKKALEQVFCVSIPQEVLKELSVKGLIEHIHQHLEGI